MRRTLGILTAALLAGGCGAAASATAPSAPASVALVLRPAKPAPALSLRNYTGAPVSLAGLSGKAVLVTFVYTHCPDVCPLIVSSLARAQRQLGPRARSLRILAVTVDPRRDTPAAIRSFLAARNATGRMDYLLGSRSQLAKTWKAWDVAVQTSAGQLTNGHSAVTYGIGASGRMTLVFPSNATPQQIASEVPLLLRN